VFAVYGVGVGRILSVGGIGGLVGVGGVSSLICLAQKRGRILAV
jgi:hypothetical protein